MSAEITDSALTRAALAYAGLGGNNLLVGERAAVAGQELLDVAVQCDAIALHPAPGELGFAEDMDAIVASYESEERLVMMMIQDYPAQVDERLNAHDPARLAHGRLLKEKVQGLLRDGLGLKLGIWLVLTDAGTDSLAHAFTDEDRDNIDNITHFDD